MNHKTEPQKEVYIPIYQFCEFVGYELRKEYCQVYGRYTVSRCDNFYHIFLTEQGVNLDLMCRTKELALEIIEYLNKLPLPKLISRGPEYIPEFDKNDPDLEIFRKGYNLIQKKPIGYKFEVTGV